MNIQATNEVHLASNVYKLIRFFCMGKQCLKISVHDGLFDWGLKIKFFLLFSVQERMPWWIKKYVPDHVKYVLKRQ